MLVLLLLAAAAAALLTASAPLRRLVRRRYMLRGIPRLRAKEAIGNFSHLLGTSRHRVVNAEKPGPVFRMRMAMTDFVLVSSGTAAGTVLREAVHKPMVVYMAKGKRLGHNIYVSQTHKGHAARIKCYRQVFSPSSVRNGEGILMQHINELCDILASTPAGEAVDVRALILAFTRDNTFHTLFDYDLGAMRQTERSKPLLGPWDTLFGEVGNQVLLNPFLAKYKWWDWRVRAAKKAATALQDFLEVIFDSFVEKYEAADQDEKRRLESTVMFGCYTLSKTLPKVDCLSDLMFIVNASHETTASTILALLHLLGMHPRALEKVQRELDESDGPEGDTTPYLEACIKEAMRLLPSAGAVNFRECQSKDLVLDGYLVPRDTPILVWSYLVHRDKATWGPDAEEFRPERFLEHKHLASNAAYAGVPGPSGEGLGFIPFAHGPRMCLGMNSGLQTVRKTAAVLLRRFNFDPVDKTTPDPTICTTSVRLDRLEMRLARRT